MSKAKKKYPNCRVVFCAEEYTSKTCSGCETLYPNIRGAKVFEYPQCNQIRDIDLNTARNSLLKKNKRV